MAQRSRVSSEFLREIVLRKKKLCFAKQIIRMNINKIFNLLQNLHEIDHSDESSDKENQINDNTSQSNERIPLPVATPAGPSNKMALDSSNATEVSDESSDKDNQTNDNTSQTNERIPPPVSAPVVQEEEREHDLVPIGSGRTLVPRDKYNMVNWKSCNTATRTLLRAVFSRAVLSTHSLTGKRSPAFPDRPAKMCLDQEKVDDIIRAVRERFELKENAIRNSELYCNDSVTTISEVMKLASKTEIGLACISAISTIPFEKIITVKCADEFKMMKTLKMKQDKN